jgi:hypothetical protein
MSFFFDLTVKRFLQYLIFFEQALKVLFFHLYFSKILFYQIIALTARTGGMIFNLHFMCRMKFVLLIQLEIFS